MFSLNFMVSWCPGGFLYLAHWWIHVPSLLSCSNAGSSVCESERRAADWPLKASEGEQLTAHTHPTPHTNITVSGSLKAANTAQATFGAFSGDILLTGPAPVGPYSQFVQKSRNKSLYLCETGLAHDKRETFLWLVPCQPNTWLLDAWLHLHLLCLQQLPANTEDLLGKSE